MSNTSHEQFLHLLSARGLTVTVAKPDVNDGFALYLNGIRAPNDTYSFFGYYCGGAYASCVRTDRNAWTNDDLDFAITTGVHILMTELQRLRNEPSYIDCRDYLRKQQERTKHAVTYSAIDRTSSILKDNYQDLIKFVKQTRKHDN